MGGLGRYTLEEMWYDDAGILTLDNEELRGLVALALTRVPKRVADRIHEKCLFLMVEDDCYYLPAKQIRGKSLICVSKSYIDKLDPEGVLRTILHEVAHFHYKHDYFDPEMTLEKSDQCEAAADRLVEIWLADSS